MIDLSVRSTVVEELDGPHVAYDTYQRCMQELDVINRITLTHQPTLRWLSKATRGLPLGAEVSILDVGYGNGDLLRAIENWAAKRRLRVALCGIDINSRSAAAARAASHGRPISYLVGDVFEFQPAEPFDFVVSSQLTHHLDDNQLLDFLSWIDTNSRRGWHIADLHRSRIAYYGFQALARIMRWHRITREDGLISVARSFRRDEWRNNLARTGMTARVKWHFGFRYTVSRTKNDPV